MKARKPWEELSDKEKCRAYEESYILEYKEDVERYTRLLETSKLHLEIAEKQFAAGEFVVSKFHRIWNW